MNASLSVASVTQIKSIIMINVNVSANSQKNFTCAKIYIYIYIYIYIFGILLHAVLKKANTQEVLLMIQ